MGQKFKRNKEDFTCDRCGTAVIGDGFTNHCPHCLFSKHVDVNPGDRASTCQGMMKPVRVEGTQKRYMIIHVCERCKYQKANMVAADDDMTAVAAVAQRAGAAL